MKWQRTKWQFSQTSYLPSLDLRFCPARELIAYIRFMDFQQQLIARAVQKFTHKIVCGIRMLVRALIRCPGLDVVPKRRDFIVTWHVLHD